MGSDPGSYCDAGSCRGLAGRLRSLLRRWLVSHWRAAAEEGSRPFALQFEEMIYKHSEEVISARGTVAGTDTPGRWNQIEKYLRPYPETPIAPDG